MNLNNSETAGKTWVGLDNQLRRQQREDTVGLRDLLLERWPSRYRLAQAGFKTEEAAAASLDALVRGDPSYLALPTKPAMKWVDVPAQCQTYPLTDPQIRGLRLAMLVEDHLPGYGDAYSRLFPIEGVSDPSIYLFNRQVRRFTPLWIYQENGHAERLFNYLMLSGQVDPVELITVTIREGQKPYTEPHSHPAGLFAYTIVQEGATQVYYQMMRNQVKEPILQANLFFLQRQEAEHRQAFTEFLEPVIERLPEQAYGAITESLNNFQMPLATMIDNYRRQAVFLAHSAGGYDYRAGFKWFVELVAKVAKARTSQRDHPVEQLLEFTKTLPNPA